MSQQITGTRPFKGIIEGEGQQQQLSNFVTNEIFDPAKLQDLVVNMESSLESDIRSSIECLHNAPGEIFISSPIQVTISPQGTVIKLGREVRIHKDGS